MCTYAAGPQAASASSAACALVRAAHALEAAALIEAPRPNKGRAPVAKADQPATALFAQSYLDAASDLLLSKHSKVQPEVLLEYVRRFPAQAWPLADVALRALQDGSLRPFQLTVAMKLLTAVVAQSSAVRLARTSPRHTAHQGKAGLT